MSGEVSVCVRAAAAKRRPISEARIPSAASRWSGSVDSRIAQREAPSAIAPAKVRTVAFARSPERPTRSPGGGSASRRRQDAGGGVGEGEAGGEEERAARAEALGEEARDGRAEEDADVRGGEGGRHRLAAALRREPLGEQREARGPGRGGGEPLQDAGEEEERVGGGEGEEERRRAEADEAPEERLAAADPVGEAAEGPGPGEDGRGVGAEEDADLHLREAEGLRVVGKERDEEVVEDRVGEEGEADDEEERCGGGAAHGAWYRADREERRRAGSGEESLREAAGAGWQVPSGGAKSRRRSAPRASVGAVANGPGNEPSAAARAATRPRARAGRGGPRRSGVRSRPSSVEDGDGPGRHDDLRAASRAEPSRPRGARTKRLPSRVAPRQEGDAPVAEAAAAVVEDEVGHGTESAAVRPAL